MSNRVFLKDLENAVYQPNAEAQVSEVHNSESTKVYTTIGKNDAVDAAGYPVLQSKVLDSKVTLAQDRDLACAMSISRPSQPEPEYYIKGKGDGRFVDPNSIDQDGRNNKTRLGLPELQWRRVNRNSFISYLEFLRTKNRAYLVNAEREVF